MEGVDVSPLHEHPLIPFTRFAFGWCNRCFSLEDVYMYAKSVNLNIYGGYRCNELGCGVVFHKECAKPSQEINHSSHPDHPLKLIITNLDSEPSTCLCGKMFHVGYSCSVCDFKLDFECARRPEPLVLPSNSYEHEHPIQLFREPYDDDAEWKNCKACQMDVDLSGSHYRCQQCEFVIHVDCVYLFPEAYHTSHPQHPLKSLKCQVPDYADKKCLLCKTRFDEEHHQLHHCDICNFSICRACMKNPPPVVVECKTTHEHQLQLLSRRLDFICNACGTQGDRSPYLCLQCGFMIHRECIGLPRVININRHDHRISYTSRLGHGEWKCKVCRQDMNEFYGAYTCSKCLTFSVHSRCATSERIWDMIEREGTPEEEEISPFEVIDENTIQHFSHDHHLQINKDGMVLPESTLCEACVFQICSEPFYSCKKCEFIIHEKCAHLPRKKRHMSNNQPFTLHTDSCFEIAICSFCQQYFTGFRYNSGHYVTIDVRCASISDSLVHESHQHTLYYVPDSDNNRCSRCENRRRSSFFSCDECDYTLDGKCALLPVKVRKNRYDDHPLFLSYGDKNVDGEYWCEACETRVNPNEGFYACNDCGVVLHISCVVGDFSYIKPGSAISCARPNYAFIMRASVISSNGIVVSNTSIDRPLCSVCNSRCKLPSILKLYKAGVYVYLCSLKCCRKLREL
ncbi:hypothetical protein AALP_AA3G359700 [Arabis alpina]|uniref:Zinc finger PHD-type domain-containing protein n=1 Tax=Arabis alpina TaxID=50452 RepID=A0A087HDX0_ARAAL|nr:hypothetical protein AALP_AA3G359700 [Arabis alpina]